MGKNIIVLVALAQIAPVLLDRAATIDKGFDLWFHATRPEGGDCRLRSYYLFSRSPRILIPTQHMGVFIKTMQPACH